ncbi:hypothetical protein L0Y65_06345 [Candidatus Micrarchaeota archaeon]|nr:hypothetical protein [Candidatus Micrarchaeota archaeon]
MARKGQASLEYLLISAVALSLLAFSASALVGIRDMALEGAAAASFRSGAISLANAISEACAMGDGNRLEVALGEAVSVESHMGDGGWMARFTGAGNDSLVRPCRCEVKEARGLSGPIYVENEDGKITIRER